MKLTGNDSKAFVEALLHPDERQQAKLKEISKNIALKDIPNGYEANINDLDMSFFKGKNNDI